MRQRLATAMRLVNVGYYFFFIWHGREKLIITYD